jgi:hypothetical protein
VLTASARRRALSPIGTGAGSECAERHPTDAKGKTVTNTIEERGTYVARPQHPHNGYYAGDFSSTPFRPTDLDLLLNLSSRSHSSSRRNPS